MAGVFTIGAEGVLPHPRPDLERKEWRALNGAWEFQFDPEAKGLQEGWHKSRPPFSQTIRVPFGWESRLSGIGRTDYKGVAWYRREFTLPDRWRGKRIWLCFGAVDHKATVWVNGQTVGEHEGGYSEFRFDITHQVEWERPNRLVVRVEDRTDPETPLGKQIPSWYTSTSGIWQTVWLEATGEAYIRGWRIIPKADAQGVPTGTLQVELSLSQGKEHRPLLVEMHSLNRQFPTVRCTLQAGEESTRLVVQVPKPHFWSPESPVLYPFEMRLRVANTQIEHDSVRGYFGIRTVKWGSYNGSNFSYVLLNGKPIYLRGVLDQSFNPEGIYTAPHEEFLKRDLVLARRAGFNLVRLHIKADEPRKLYWADRLGILVQADIPCFFQPSERARQLFEGTLRDQIERDFNHPSLIIWTLFNEEWGIGSFSGSARPHRVDWVLEMCHLTRKLDPTRLIQDNTGWAHLETDLNSFHWYGRDVDAFRQKYQQVNRLELGKGKGWNYVDGRTSRGEPFINNEFGYLAAFDGDGDWSWGVLFAMNALRGLDKLVGYTYTELTDIEWEHNGVYNYDRSPKELGFDFWAQGMQVSHLFAEDFLVLDVPAIKRAKCGERVSVPILLSHYSGRWTNQPLWVGYRLDWLDTLGKKHQGQPVRQMIRGMPAYRLSPLVIAEVEMPRKPAFATLVAWLEDSQGTRLQRNYTQWAVELENLPRLEWDTNRRLFLRFSPNDYTQSRFSELSAPSKRIEGKHYGCGHGFVEYSVPLPEEVPLDRLQTIALHLEVAAKAGREKVDWAERVHPEDYPQTDGKKFPSRVKVEIAGEPVATWELPDDPADARGALSHWQGVERGSYGYLRSATLKLTPKVRAQLEQERKVPIRLMVPPDQPGGVAIYGAQMGCYPLEPTLVLSF